MIDGFKNSLNKTLNERIKSPFYGSFIISWLIWNWRIIYLTFFVSEYKLDCNKLTYIINNYLIFDRLFLSPLLSAIFLISIGPWFNISSKWLHLWYEQIRIKQNQKIIKAQLLSREESIAIQEQLFKEREEFQSIIEKKNKQIRELELELEKNGLNPDKSGTITSYKELEELAYQIKGDPNEFSMFTELLKSIQGGYKFNNIMINPMFVYKLESHGVIQSINPGVYKLLPNGIKLERLINK